MSIPTIAEVKDKIQKVEKKIKEIEGDPDYDLELKSLLVTGYRNMIAKGEQWIKENQPVLQ